MADHDHDGDSDSLSSSSSESYEEVEASVEDVALQAQLETSLEGNPRQYDVQLQVSLPSPCVVFRRNEHDHSFLSRSISICSTLPSSKGARWAKG